MATENGSNPGTPESELIRALGDLPESVLAELQELPPDFLERLAAQPPEVLDGLTRLPLATLKSMAGLSAAMLTWIGTVSDRVAAGLDSAALTRLVSLAQDSRASLRQLQRLSPAILRSLTGLPSGVLNSLVALPPELLQQLPSVFSATAETLDEIPSLKDLSDDASPELIATLDQMPAGAIESLSSLSPESLATVAELKPETLQALGELTPEAAETLSDIPENVLSTVFELPLAEADSLDTLDPTLLAALSQTKGSGPATTDTISASPEPSVPRQIIVQLGRQSGGSSRILGRLLSEARSLKDIQQSSLQFVDDDDPSTLDTLPEIAADTLAAGDASDDAGDSRDGRATLPESVPLDAAAESNDTFDDDEDSFDQTMQSDEWSSEGLSVFDQSDSAAGDADDVSADDASADGALSDDASADSGATMESADFSHAIEPEGLSNEESYDQTVQIPEEGISDESFSQTVALDENSRAAVREATQTLSDDDDSFGETVQSDDFQAAFDSHEEFPDADDSYSATVESGEGWSSEGLSALERDGSGDRPNQTMQSDDWQKPAVNSPSDSDEDSYAATIQSSDLPGGGTEEFSSADDDADSFGATMQTGSVDGFGDDADSFDMTVQSGENATHDESFGQTLESAELDNDVKATMADAWGTDFSSNARPGMTIKSDSLEQSSGKNTLIITPKQLSTRNVKDYNKGRALPEPENPDYELIKKLGEGGMGVVYVARQRSIDREVALKMLKAKTAKDKEQRAKFLTEAVVTGELDHPNIVPIYDVGASPDDALFYAMKKVEGTPWLDDLKEAFKSLETIDPSLTDEEDIAEARRRNRANYLSRHLDILTRVADAVAFAHDRGVIHRDLKPENVMLGAFNEVLVMDWGLAYSTDDFRKSGSITESTSMGGTPAYMAPEMATGPIKKIGAHSDIYLLGAILFEVVTGKPPHAGKNAMKCLMAAARNQIRDVDEDKVNEIDPTGELLAIARKAMETKSEDRFKTVAEMQAALREYKSHTESVVLTIRAAGDLAEAKRDQDYDSFARARFAYEEALALWSRNRRAREGLTETRYEYAKCAKAKGDFDLGMSLLDVKNEQHKKLYDELDAAKQTVLARERQLEEHKRRSARQQKIIQTIVVVALLVVSALGTFAGFQWQDAVMQKGIAEQKRQEAEDAQKKEAEQRLIAQANFEEAEKQREIAEENFEEAEKQRTIAQKNFEEAETQRKVAVQAKEDEEKQRLIADEKRKEAVVAQMKAEEAQKKEAEQRMVAQKNFEEAEKQRKAAVAAKEAEEKQKQLAQKNFEEAEKQRKIADEKRKEAVVAQTKAEVAQKKEAEQRMVAQKNFEEAEKQRKAAVAAREAEEKQKQIAQKNFEEAEKQRKIAVAAKDAEEEQAYIARIGLADARIRENAFDTALAILHDCPPRLRDWEWGRLMHLCTLSIGSFDNGAPVEAIAVSPDHKRFVTGGWNGQAVIWDADSGQALLRLPHGGLYVHSVDWSRDGRWIATGSNDTVNGYVQLWDAETGQRVDRRFGDGRNTASSHTDEVLSVRFSADGAKLLTASYDMTARLWNVESGAQLRRFLGHTWWVWDAEFSPDEKTIVTAGQDGKAFLWDTETGEPGAPFTGHDGPIFSASFSPDGVYVATGGYDKRVLIWKPADVRPYDFRRLQSKNGNVIPEPRFTALDGHSGPVRSVRYSEDGQFLISGSDDNTIRLWSTEGGQLVKSFRGHDGAVRAVAFARQNAQILSASHDNRIRKWDIGQYEEVRTLQGQVLEGHEDAILSASFSPSGQQIVTASRDRTARTWDAMSGQTLKVFSEGHAFLASSAAFFPGGRRLATGAVDNTVRVWDVDSGTQLFVLEHTGRSAALAISHDGRWIVTGSDSRTAKIWDADSGELKFELTGNGQGQTGHQNEVTAVAVSPDSRLVLTGDARGRVLLWDLPTRKIIRQFNGHSRMRISAATFVPGTDRILTACADKTVAQWNLKTGKEEAALILRHPDSVISMSLRPGTKQVLTATADGSVRLWDIDKAEVLATLDGGGAATHVAIDESGQWGLSVDSDARKITVWPLEGASGSIPPTRAVSVNSQLWAAIFAPSRNGLSIVTLGGSDARIVSVENSETQTTFSPHGIVASANYSPDGKRIVTGSWDGSARVWDTDTGADVLKLAGDDGHTGVVNSAVFSPDPTGSRILTASDDGTAKVWDAKTGQLLLTLKGHTDRVRHAVYSPDGALILTASSDRTARLWNAQTGAPDGQPLQGHEWAILSAAFSSDGSRIITGSEDNTARIWDVKTGESIATLTGHTARVTSVTFAPGQRRAVTASQDGTVKVWDIDSAEEVLTLDGHTREVTSVTFSPDGRFLLSASQDGRAIVWLTTDWHGTAPTAVAVTAE
ncbi:protein kinase [bacterium]|nr:protein kinase [bacterium]